MKTPKENKTRPAYLKVYNEKTEENNNAEILMQHEAKPVFTLTIGEFIRLTKDLIKEALKQKSGEKDPGHDSADSEEHFNISGLAAFLKCSKVSIHQYKKKGLPFYKIGRKLIFKKSEVLNFMRGQKNKRVIQS